MKWLAVSLSLHIKSIFLHHLNRAEGFIYLPSNVHDEAAGRPTTTNPTSAADGGRGHEPRRGGGEGVEEHEGSRHAADTAGRARHEPSDRLEPWRRPTLRP